MDRDGQPPSRRPVPPGSCARPIELATGSLLSETLLSPCLTETVPVLYHRVFRSGGNNPDLEALEPLAGKSLLSSMDLSFTGGS
jgi:hypothetical protein